MGRMTHKAITKCMEEIEWAKANISKMNISGNPHNYCDADKFYLPHWLKTHEDMLADIQLLYQDALTMALRLAGEDDDTFAPELYEVMKRWRPIAIDALKHWAG